MFYKRTAEPSAEGGHQIYCLLIANSSGSGCPHSTITAVTSSAEHSYELLCSNGTIKSAKTVYCYLRFQDSFFVRE